MTLIRALRKAYGIGLCSVEELGSLSSSQDTAVQPLPAAKEAAEDGSNNFQPRLHEKLCLLIRQYNLDPVLVRAYAADLCGTKKLNGASPGIIESFINQLAKVAKENRDSRICLNFFSKTVEVHS